MTILGRLIWIVILQPIAYGWFFVIIFIDSAAQWLDAIFHTHLRTPKITKEEVEHLIETHLPPGSSSGTIVAFLEQRKINHPDEFIFDLEALDYEDRAFANNPKVYEKKALIKRAGVAWIDNVSKGLVIRDDIRIMFYFNEQNILISADVDVFYTGP